MLGTHRAAGERPLVVGRGVGPLSCQAAFCFSCFLVPFFSHVVNSFSLATTHTRPAQILLKTSNTHNF
jgi:hypothetical protein